MRKILLVTLMSTTAMLGCKKKTTEEGGAGGADKGTETAANLPALTAEADPGTITAADHEPFDSVKFRMLAKRNKNGWPEFDAYNLGTKTITFLAITGYAYDKDGKQVARTTVPLSWNGKLAAGAKTDWSMSVGGMSEKMPETAATYQLCYSSVTFEGDAKGVDDNTKCPDQRPKK